MKLHGIEKKLGTKTTSLPTVFSLSWLLDPLIHIKIPVDSNSRLFPMDLPFNHFLYIQLLCSSRKYPYPPYGRLMEIQSRGGGGLQKPNFLNGSMTIKWNFQRGGGFNSKNLPWEGYGYFLQQHISNSHYFNLFFGFPCELYVRIVPGLNCILDLYYMANYSLWNDFSIKKIEFSHHSDYNSAKNKSTKKISVYTIMLIGAHCHNGALLWRKFCIY